MAGKTGKRGHSTLNAEQRKKRAREAAQKRWERVKAAERAEETVLVAEPALEAEVVEPEPEEPQEPEILDVEIVESDPEPTPPPPPPPRQPSEPLPHETATQLMRDVADGVERLLEENFSFKEFLPQRLRERFEKTTRSGDRLSNFEQVSLLDLRISQICERIDTAESGRRWREARAAMRSLTVAMQQGDNDAVGEAYAELNSAINRGANDADNWLEMMNVIETRRRVTETELKRIRSAHDWISAQDALDLITTISESVNRHADPTAKALISADIERAIGATGA